MTVADMRRRMQQSEFVEWVAFYRHRARQREAADKKAQQQAKARRPRRR